MNGYGHNVGVVAACRVHNEKVVDRTSGNSQVGWCCLKLGRIDIAPSGTLRWCDFRPLLELRVSEYQVRFSLRYDWLTRCDRSDEAPSFGRENLWTSDMMVMNEMPDRTKLNEPLFSAPTRLIFHGQKSISEGRIYHEVEICTSYFVSFSLTAASYTIRVVVVHVAERKMHSFYSPLSLPLKVMNRIIRMMMMMKIMNLRLPIRLL